DSQFASTSAKKLQSSKNIDFLISKEFGYGILNFFRSLFNNRICDLVAQSISAITHSYTTVISADGRLLSPLLMVLKEPSPRIQETIFTANNIFIMASKSSRNAILKLQSLTHDQFLLPFYITHFFYEHYL
ncbi:hypothetical protein ALC53_13213, partial [Atta colombica]